MKKILSLIIFILFFFNHSYSNDEKAKSWNNANEMPEKARPNDATISLFEERKKRFIENQRRKGDLYIIEPKGNAVKFKYEKNLESLSLKKELSKGYVLSYLFYDNGIIKYDGLAKKGRFKEDITNETLFFTL